MLQDAHLHDLRQTRPHGKSLFHGWKRRGCCKSSHGGHGLPTIWRAATSTGDTDVPTASDSSSVRQANAERCTTTCGMYLFIHAHRTMRLFVCLFVYTKTHRRRCCVTHVENCVANCKFEADMLPMGVVVVVVVLLWWLLLLWLWLWLWWWLLLLLL